MTLSDSLQMQARKSEANHHTQRTRESRCLHITPVARAAGVERYAKRKNYTPMQMTRTFLPLALLGALLVGCAGPQKNGASTVTGLMGDPQVSSVQTKAAIQSDAQFSRTGVHTRTGLMSDPQFTDASTITGLKAEPQFSR